MKKLTVLPLLFFALSCQQTNTFDEASARAEILDLHHAQRDYHFNKKKEEFASMMSDDFIGVGRGEITRPTYEDNIKRYTAYFGSVEFIKWDDLTEPVIRFSDDGSLAYTIVDKEVIVSYEGDEGATLMDTTHYAWTAIYRKKDIGWKIESVASTNE